jgi:hypothetical protein
MSSEYPVATNTVRNRIGQYYGHDTETNTWYYVVNRRFYNRYKLSKQLEKRFRLDSNQKTWIPIPTSILDTNTNLSKWKFYADPQTIGPAGFTSNNTSFRNLPLIPNLSLNQAATQKNKKNKGAANLQQKSPNATSSFFPGIKIAGTRKRSRRRASSRRETASSWKRKNHS